MLKEILLLRKLRESDCKLISKAFSDQGWNKPEAQYRKYFEFQQAGIRDVIIAEFNGDFAGYLTILWQSPYPSFKMQNIPEVVDFNVLEKYQRLGIGTALMDEAEQRIRKVSKIAGIGVGMTKDYGKAQILYIKRNYVPDGNGLIKKLKPVGFDDEITIDDDLVLYLTKELRT